MTATRPPGYDDRSAAPVEASRRGAHRARPKAIAAIFPVIAGVVVVLLVIGAVYTVVGKKDNSPATNSAAKSALEDEANSTANPDAGATKGGKADSSTKPSATSKADKSIKVIVLNSLNVQGLATSYKDKLEGKGWTVDYTDNSSNRDLPVTKIYYDEADMKATASGVRKAIGGIGELKQSDQYPGEICVVLGQDTQ